MRAFIASLALGIAACSSHHHDPNPAKANVVPQPAEPAMAATSEGPPGSQDLAPLADLGNRLGAEGQHRPAVAVTPEKLFTALAGKGVKLQTQHQVLASVAAASYCALGVTTDSVAIAVCEYPTHRDAEAGRAMLDRRYAKLVPDAVRAVNGSTLVTVANAGSRPELRDRVLTTFAAL